MAKHLYLQHVAFAFIAGGLLTYLCVTFLGNTDAHLVFFSSGALFSPHAASACIKNETAKAIIPPPGYALSPMASGNSSSGGVLASDRLIVAARHSDDPGHYEQYWRDRVHTFYRRDLHTLDVSEGMTEDTSWLDIYLSEIPHVVYQVDDWDKTEGAEHRTLVNKGNEAMAYLQFILDYWGRFPASMVFLHGHRGTWHIKDHVPLLRRLRWGEVPYASLRYRNGPDNRLPWKCRGQTDDEAFLKFDCNWVGNWLRPGSMQPRKEKDITPMNKDEWIDSLEVNEVWSETFEKWLGPIPKALHGPCCAEFIVSRERIEAHPREFYEHLRDWIIETEFDRYRSGRVFEYMWAVMFGAPPVSEPIEECDLLTCTDEEEKLASRPSTEEGRRYISSSNASPAP
ncbi:hypothetical protein CVIRNUC_009604 [Coccomyxa viridis]|uniref:Uncharacterized protein n=1 Tax=Coccomyxa viridis TaxID=1274662 RepID=A0AAV1IGE4_9CHLO|nr:hypothetical protein CVIRNUC_009604 [Coccomyxa viridis]